MIQPTIVFYGRLDFDSKSGKSPKYVLTSVWGNYSPMEALRGRNGMVSMYLLPKREGQSSNCPQMHLQAKGSLNLSGLKDYFINGKLSGFAFGFPPSTPTYSSKAKPNPFFPSYKEDGFCLLSTKTKKHQHQPSSKDPIISSFSYLMDVRF